MSDVRSKTERLFELLRAERGCLTDFLLELAEFHRRQSWRELGYTGLFYFLHRELGLSKGAAFYRKVAVELILEYPEVIEPLRDGRLCLSSISELARIITPENRSDVLPRFFHASRAEAKAVAAELDPEPESPVRDVVRAIGDTAPVPTLRSTSAHDAAAGGPDASTDALAGSPDSRADGARPEPGGTVKRDEPSTATASASPAARLTSPPLTSVQPLAADLHRLHVTVSGTFLRKLSAARDALSHTPAGGASRRSWKRGSTSSWLARRSGRGS